MRRGGSYERKGDKLIRKEHTETAKGGARPYDSNGHPMYVRPHEVAAAQVEKEPAPVAKKEKDKGVSDES